MPSKGDDLPPALPSMWRAVRRGYEAEPRLLVASFGLSLLAALPDALLALWLKLLADGVLAQRRGLVLAPAPAVARCRMTSHEASRDMPRRVSRVACRMRSFRVMRHATLATPTTSRPAAREFRA